MFYDEYRYKKTDGSLSYDVNSNGYDRDGVFRGRDGYYSSRSGGNTATGGLLFLVGIFVAAYIFEKYFDYIVSIGGIVAVCAIANFIIKLTTQRWDIISLITFAGIGAIISVFVFSPRKILYFLENNWIYLVTCLGILLVTIIVGSIVKRKSNKPKLVTFFCILAAIGLMSSVIYLGPVSKYAKFANLRQIITFPVKSTVGYAYVNIDSLNIRSGPSVNNEIVGRLSKDDRIEIIEKSGHWWKMRFKNIEGYVASQYLRSE